MKWVQPVKLLHTKCETLKNNKQPPPPKKKQTTGTSVVQYNQKCKKLKFLTLTAKEHLEW